MLYTILGGCWCKKWSPFFCVGAGSAVFCHLKTGTFGKSACFQVPKNGTSGAKTKKLRPLFNANIPPKWCRARLFYAFSTFGWILSQFKKFGKRSERIFCGPWKSANSCHPECRYTLKRDSLTFHLPICSRQLSYSAWLCCLQYRKTTQMPLVQGS